MSAFRREGPERQLLGLLLLTGGRDLARLRVDGEHFGDPRGVAILRAMRRLAAAGRSIDVVTVWQATGGLEGGCATYVADVRRGEKLSV